MNIEKLKIYIKNNNQTKKKISEINSLTTELTKNEFRSIITTLGTDIKNKIIYETYHNPENFIPLQEVEKSSENSPLFIKGILSKFLIKNDISVAIKRENQNKEENETLSKTMIQLISSGEIFKKIMALSYDFGEEKNANILTNEEEKKNL